MAIVEYQWLGNTANNNKGSFLPGWTRTTHPNVYYAEIRKHHSHKPYLGHGDIAIKQKDIILHGFTLTVTRKLPASVRRALDDDVRVGGEINQSSIHTIIHLLFIHLPMLCVLSFRRMVANDTGWSEPVAITVPSSMEGMATAQTIRE